MQEEGEASHGLPLAGRRVVVGGASGGIGRAITLALTQAGAEVSAVARDRERLEDVVEQAPLGAVTAHALDLRDTRAVAQLAERQRAAGPVHAIIHASTPWARGTWVETETADLERLLVDGVRAFHGFVRLLLPAMADAGDVVVLNSSQGVGASAGTGGYAALQHALRALTDALRAEVNERGVRVMSVHLGRTATPLQERIFAEEGRTYRPELLVQPEDVADVVVAALLLDRRAEITELHMRPTARSY